MTQVNKYADENLSFDTGADFKPLDAGLKPAVCVGIVFLGTVPSEYTDEKGNKHKKQQKKVKFIFELVGLKRKDKDGKDVPYTIETQELTGSMNSRAGLRTFVEEWGGRKMTDDQAKVFNIVKCLGLKCNINLLVQPDAKDESKKYNNIGSVAGPMAGQIIADAETEPFYFDIRKQPFMTEEYNKLRDKLKERVQQSEEYLAMANMSINAGGMPGANPATPDAGTAPLPTTASGGDLPF